MFRAFSGLHSLIIIILLAVLPTSSKAAAAITQEQLNLFAAHLDVKYRVLANLPADQCQSGVPCYRIQLDLTLPFDFSPTGWQVYLSQLDKLSFVSANDLDVELVNGDLKVLTPSPEFSGFKASIPHTVTLELKGNHYTEYKPLPNYYATASGLTPQIITATRELTDPHTGIGTLSHVATFTDPHRQFRTTPDDMTPWATATTLYANNRDLSETDEHIAQAIIPTPASYNLLNAQPADIRNGLHFIFDGFRREDVQPAIERLRALGVTSSAQGLPVTLIRSAAERFPDEAYSLRIEASGITINSATPAGAAYALASVTALLQLGDSTLPALSIADQPRFTYRGMHLDVARNFHSKSSVIELLDQMAAYKLNVLHLHLSDDEGWRVEIDGLPELTDIGGFRCHDLTEEHCLLPQLGSGPSRDTPVNGFYSKADFIDILRAADARHIEILPSFDMPGHARAAIKAMEARYRRYMAEGQPDLAKEYLLTDFNDKTAYRSIQNYNDNTINVCMPSAYRFVEKVVDELSELYQQAGLTMKKYHLGGDESPGAWLASPACQALLAERKKTNPQNLNLGGYFIERIANLLAQKNIVPAGWNDGLDHTEFDNMPARVQSHIWALLADNATQLTHKHLNQGWDVVLSLPEVSYFDMPHEAHPKERGYDWAARHINSRKVFSYMPENLPMHAEVWRNLHERPFSISDTPVKQPGRRVLGIQGHLWSETIRNEWQAQTMIFPRLIALAERAWHRADWEPGYAPDGKSYNQNTGYFSRAARTARDQAFNRFANTLAQKELLKLDALDVGYRIPTVGAQIDNGKLHINILLPGLPLEYRINGGVWQTYSGPVDVPEGVVEVRARSADNLRAGRSLLVSTSLVASGNAQ
ncbi:family 20 glycosylhydrolase [Alteromonas gilva]|uniref:beta-N-acetylhexosaminidase n=1 Tax=Alteromonas gilva TaxID=2987522 RepID=A0ABT5L923_9ALTE|nr:family 20 glycosylhydrolase [Alteromonas gilva]MDC8832463.1 family 20 glycosylhydrolase [Alteromonas gilva]